MKTLLLASAAALALTGGAYAHPALPPTVVKLPATAHSMHVIPHNGSTTLYSQIAGSSPYATASNNLTSGYCTTSGFCYATLDTIGADDFVIPGAGNHAINVVNAGGYSYGQFGGSYQYPGSFNVTFYKKYKVKKGVTKVKQLLACGPLPYTLTNPVGNVSIDVSKCTKGTKFKGGHAYGLTVQANDNYRFGGFQYWFWDTNAVQNFNSGSWDNTGGGFGFCLVLTPNKTCFPTTGIGPDYAFELEGI